MTLTTQLRENARLDCFQFDATVRSLDCNLRSNTPLLFLWLVFLMCGLETQKGRYEKKRGGLESGKMQGEEEERKEEKLERKKKREEKGRHIRQPHCAILPHATVACSSRLCMLHARFANQLEGKFMSCTAGLSALI